MKCCVKKVVIVCLVVVAVQSCSWPQAVSYNMKHSLGAKAPQSAPSITHEKRKIGNPYSIPNEHGENIWYSPLQSSEGYSQTGVASWYGKDFHAKNTANGETYNMYAYTAAHKTLPLPTYVRVTNLENNKSIVVRVNDRGPFFKNRLIDMSYAGAKALGFDKQGTARVKVDAISVHGGDVKRSNFGYSNSRPLYQEPRSEKPMAKVKDYAAPTATVSAPSTGFTSRYNRQANAQTYQRQQAPVYNNAPAQAQAHTSFTHRIANRNRAVNTATNSQMAPKAASVTPTIVRGDRMVQIASFSDVNNARKLYYAVSKSINGVKITSVPLNGKTYYRVVVESTDKPVEQILQDVQDAGFRTAIITKVLN